MKRLQIYYPEDLIKTFRVYAKRQGISLAEVIREAGREYKRKTMIIRDEPMSRQVRRKRVSILDMAGIIKEGPKDGSMTVDEIYLDEND